jgi:hypothetical protein
MDRHGRQTIQTIRLPGLQIPVICQAIDIITIHALGRRTGTHTDWILNVSKNQVSIVLHNTSRWQIHIRSINELRIEEHLENQWHLYRSMGKALTARRLAFSGLI